MNFKVIFKICRSIAYITYLRLKSFFIKVSVKFLYRDKSPPATTKKMKFPSKNLK